MQLPRSSDCRRRNGGSRSSLLAAAILLTIVASGCGGGGGNPPTPGKGDPGDTFYADSVIEPYFVDNNLVDPEVPPNSALPRMVDNTDLLAAVDNSGQLGTLPVSNQGAVGTCVAVTFTQMVYGADAKAGATAPLLDNVQYSYLFARYFEEKGGPDWKKDDGSYAYTNFEALTNETYRQDFANGHLPIDGRKGGTNISHPTGVFFPFDGSPNLEEPTEEERAAGFPAAFWNKINLWKKLDSGPTTLTMTIRRVALSPTSLDVKKAVADRNLLRLGISANDAKKQWDNRESRLTKKGILELPYKPNPNGKWEGHGMLIVGYDDAGYGKYGGAGAFKVRNSWGPGWGDKGYWYLPYSVIDDVAGKPEGSTFPLNYDDNFVYISQISHD